MKTVDINFIAIGALWLVVGMLLGIGMGAAHNFALAPLHAHINLIGFVCHAVFGMAYRHWPALKVRRSRLISSGSSSSPRRSR